MVINQSFLKKDSKEFPDQIITKHDTIDRAPIFEMMEWSQHNISVMANFKIAFEYHLYKISKFRHLSFSGHSGFYRSCNKTQG